VALCRAGGGRSLRCARWRRRRRRWRSRLSARRCGSAGHTRHARIGCASARAGCTAP